MTDIEKDFLTIKKLYGESFAKFCRKLFPTILETPNLLVELLTNRFAPNHSLYSDIIANNKTQEFKSYIFYLFNEKQHKTELLSRSIESPEELMKKAGYTLFMCKTHDDVMKFIDYYYKKEIICTFDDKLRTHNYTVFFAVRNDAETLKRADFLEPEREDAYGTSVISLQFDKAIPNELSIKNRYNHSVSNPDATFGNNLENIYPGLTESFVDKYGLVLKSDDEIFNMKNYVRASDNLLYQYNASCMDYFACSNNILIKGRDIIYFNKDKYLLIDNYLVDFEKKTIVNSFNMSDGFSKLFKNITDLQLKKEGENKVISVTSLINNKECVSKIVVNDKNQIIEFENNDIDLLEDGFMYYCKYLKKVSLNNVTTIENDCFAENENILELDLPNVVTIGDLFMHNNIRMLRFSAKQLQSVGCQCLYKNTDMKEIIFENLEYADAYFMANNIDATKLYIPKLKNCRRYMLNHNIYIEEIFMPSVEYIESYCFTDNVFAKSVSFPKVLKVENNCFTNNCSALTVNFDFLTFCDFDFFAKNEIAENVYFSNLTNCEANFFANNTTLKHLNAPYLKYISNNFFSKNKNLVLNAPNLDASNIKYENNENITNYIKFLKNNSSDDFLNDF